MPATITPDEAIRRYGDAQGNILKGHGRKNVALLFVEFGNPAGARQWISQLVNTTGADVPRIISTKQQLEDRKKHQDDSTFDAGLFTILLFTADGLRHLQVPKLPEEPKDQAPRGRDGAFAAGMRNLATSQLNDPDLSAWEPGWHDGPGNGPSPIHAMLLVADDDGKLSRVVEATKQTLGTFDIRLRVEEQGQRLKEQNQDIEHFGYADGVSQPLFLTDDANGPAPHSRDTELGAEDLVLVKDVLSPQPDAWGSFLVFRKLAQQVPKFKEAEEALAKELGLDGKDEDRAGAMLVGRFEDGTPVVKQENDGVAPITNDFDYSEDKEGLKCPFHAHIRKMNPRGETNDDLELRHRITRRGVPYGTREEATKGKPAGLLFMCYQRNIGRQFEFLQRGWANNARFLRPLVSPGADVDLDPIIGQGERGSLTFPTIWGGSTAATASFAQFVTLRGGEYFYAPSVSGLKRLAGAAPAL